MVGGAELTDEMAKTKPGWRLCSFITISSLVGKCWDGDSADRDTKLLPKYVG